MTRTALTANTTWYVDVNGNDSTGDGSSGNPWQTPQYAIEKIQRDYDMAGFSPTLQFNDGNWTIPNGQNTFCSGNGPCVGANGPGVSFKLVGNMANPQNCVVNLGVGQYGFSVGNHFVGEIYGFQFNCPSSVAGAIPLFASEYAAADFGNMIFTHNYNGVNCYSVGLGTLLMVAPATITGNMFAMFAAQGGAQIKAATTITIPTALAFGQFTQALEQGLIDITYMQYTGAGVAGCTGQKGNASMGSTILINANQNAAPGNAGWVKDSTSAIA